MKQLLLLGLFIVAGHAASVRHMSMQDEIGINESKKSTLKATFFDFAKVFQNRMVLQKGPQRANVFGFSPDVGQKVTLQLVTVPATRTYNYETTVQQGPSPGVGTWNFVLDPFAAGVTVSIKVESAGNSITISDVIFGDVWICSGQSNMQMTVSMINDAAQEIANAHNYPNIRLLTIDLVEAATPQYDLIKIEEDWSKPANDTVGHWDWSYFSAVCWLFGKEIHIARNYPIGLISTNWGGTPIKAWSSPEALAACGVTNVGTVESYLPRVNFGDKFGAVPENNSVLWNSMIHPLLGMTLYGAIWYQGESDAWGVRMTQYNCTFPTMIKDWRKNFNTFSNGQTSASFPFGFVQLAPYKPDGPTVGFSDIRWHQTADRGYVPNPDMVNVFMAVAIDLPDFDHDPIHPRYKREVGHRLRISGMAVAYQQGGIFQGPLPSGSNIATSGLVLDYGNVWTLEVRVTKGFEVQCSPSNTWVAAPIVAHTQTTVTVNSTVCRAGEKVNGVRYAWSESPCELYKCAVYETSQGLPAPPFVSYADYDSLGNPHFRFDQPTRL